jgi:hypothetical protein
MIRNSNGESPIFDDRWGYDCHLPDYPGDETALRVVCGLVAVSAFLAALL